MPFRAKSLRLCTVSSSPVRIFTGTRRAIHYTEVWEGEVSGATLEEVMSLLNPDFAYLPDVS